MSREPTPTDEGLFLTPSDLIRRTRKASRGRWAISAEHRRDIVEAMMDIVRRDEPTNQIQAAKLLSQLLDSDTRYELEAIKLLQESPAFQQHAGRAAVSGRTLTVTQVHGILGQLVGQPTDDGHQQQPPQPPPAQLTDAGGQRPPARLPDDEDGE